MNTRNAHTLLVLATLCAGSGSTAAAQTVRAEFGVSGGRGIEKAYENGLGGTAGLLIGSKIYVGARGMRHWGSTTRIASATTLREEENRAWIWTAELGVQLVDVGLEVRAVANLGAVVLDQTATVGPNTGGAGTTTDQNATQFLAAPGVVFHLPLRVLKLGGELHYLIAGDPDFSTAADTRSFVFYARLIVPVALR